MHTINTIQGYNHFFINGTVEGESREERGGVNSTVEEGIVEKTGEGGEWIIPDGIFIG